MITYNSRNILNLLIIFPDLEYWPNFVTWLEIFYQLI